MNDSTSTQQAQDSQWCLVGNIVQQRPYGQAKELRPGTKNFSGGTKVYGVKGYWGARERQIKVVGRHRKSNRFVAIVINANWVINWRAQVVYSPTMLQRINLAAVEPWNSKDEIEDFIRMRIESKVAREIETLDNIERQKETCRYCKAKLPNHLSQQCFACGWDWHDPDHPVKRGKANWNRWGIDKKLMYHVVLCQRADGDRYYEIKTIDEIETSAEIVRMTEMMSGTEVLAWLQSGKQEHLKLTTGEQFLFDAHGIWLTYAEAEYMRYNSPKWWDADQSFWVNGVAPKFPPA